MTATDTLGLLWLLFTAAIGHAVGKVKVVINKCFGGFSLSPAAVQRLAELQGRPCYFTQSAIVDGNLTEVAATPESIAEAGRVSLFSAYDVPVEEALSHHIDGKDWHGLSDAEKAASNAWFDKHSIDIRPADRGDLALVQVVEELGSAASGSCAQLAIVEIPDGTDYEIEEYDGMEHVAERHRTWR